MSTGSEPPPRRVADYLRRRRDGPEAVAAGPVTPLWWLSRLALAAALAFGVYVIALFALGWGACACTPRPASNPPTPDIASPADGVVVAVDSSGLSDVRGFTLRTSGGFAFTFVLGPLENATEFSPSHLAEHMASSEPIRVWFRVEGDERVVNRLEDAPET